MAHKTKHPACQYAFFKRTSLILLALTIHISMVALLNGQTGEQAVLHDWTFNETSTVENVLAAAKGELNVEFAGPQKWWKHKQTSALILNGKLSSIKPLATPQTYRPPQKAVTVEAWLLVDAAFISKSGNRTAIIRTAAGNQQDALKKGKPKQSGAGFTLGIVEGVFTFSVQTTEAKDPTQLKSSEKIQPNRWYHVVGTYDGVQQKLLVNGRVTTLAKVQKGDIAYPTNLVYRLANDRVADRDYPMSGLLHAIRISGSPQEDHQIATHYKHGITRFPTPLQITLGPMARHLDPHTVEVIWRTNRPSNCTISWRRAAESVLSTTNSHQPDNNSKDRRTEHRGVFRDVEAETFYQYQIQGVGPSEMRMIGDSVLFDSTFEYTGDSLPVVKSPYPEDDLSIMYRRSAKEILEQAKIDRGVCLVLGAEKGRLAYELALRSNLKIVAIESDEKKVAAARTALAKTGLYGSRISVHHGPLDRTAYASYMANLIVSDRMLTGGKLPGSATEIFRLLRPAGGIAMLGQAPQAKAKQISQEQFKSWLAAGKIPTAAINFDDGISVDDDAVIWTTIRRASLSGSGEWTHQYGTADNSSCSQDSLVHGDLRVLWFGRPGARPMADRGGRNPAPVAAGGRMFVQGDRILFGMDAYNGTINFSWQIPDLRRSNIPRDSGNIVASADAVHFTVGGQCINLDPVTGDVKSVFSLPADKRDGYNWGYLSRSGGLLLGSAVRKSGAYIADKGEWYDGKGRETDKVAGDNLFAVDPVTGKTKWEYRFGRVVHSTITIGDGKVYFVEGRSPEAMNNRSGRLGSELDREQYLVALDLKTGFPVWQKRIDFNKCKRVFYIAHSGNKLLLSGTSDQYYLYALSSDDGEPLWQKQWKWPRGDDHGAAMQHPVVVGDTVFSEYRAFNMADGAPRVGLPQRGHGCGIQAASLGSLFYRGGYHTQWNIKSNKQSQIATARSGCWLGMIPSGGIILAPESSSGCSCTHALQTSMAFAPLTAFKTSLEVAAELEAFPRPPGP